MREPNKDDPESFDEPLRRCENCMEHFDKHAWPRECSDCDKPCCNVCAQAGLCTDCREKNENGDWA